MSLQIVSACVGCWACVDVCPNQAIRASGSPRFAIDRGRCTECAGEHAEPQCAAICPIEGAIVDAAGSALNPPGSLTGVPVAKLIEFGLLARSPHG